MEIRTRVADNSLKIRGYVRWELVGKVWRPERGRAENAVVDTGRAQLAKLLSGATVSLPRYVAVGTGTTDVSSSQTDLIALSKYDGINDAKLASSVDVKGQFTTRILTQFTQTEANINIKELGLFDAANNPKKMWARVRVAINKTSVNRLNVFWYITLERRSGVAIKTGASISATGTYTQNADSTLTFASNVTVLQIHNNTGVALYVRLNAAMSGNPPNDYDFRLPDGGSLFIDNEAVEISTVHVFGSATGFTLPDNRLVCKGW